MIQEIVTYIIITLAVVYVFYRFFGKKTKKTDSTFTRVTYGHNCSDCSADCLSRDITRPLSGEDKNICKKTKVNNF
ncbi:MAG: hypothetical protein CSA36_05660 [Draconibacterium sp.]|nr:MAG: hypothetical protein CSA36_05660 [Draconibacterium sp.]